jgi:hypothetical protein
MRTIVVSAHGQVAGLLNGDTGKPDNFVEVLDVDQGLTLRLEVTNEDYQSFLSLIYGEADLSEQPEDDPPNLDDPEELNPDGSREPDEF